MAVSQRECWTCPPPPYPQIPEPWAKLGCPLWITGTKCLRLNPWCNTNQTLINPEPLLLFHSCLGHYDQHGQSKHGRLIWVKGMKQTKNTEEWKGQRKKRGCAIFNSDYLRVKCAVQSLSQQVHGNAMLWPFASVNVFPMCGLTIPHSIVFVRKGSKWVRCKRKVPLVKLLFLYTDMWLGGERGKGRDGVGQKRKAMVLWMNLSVGGPEISPPSLSPSPPTLLLNTFGTSRLAFKQSCRG